MKEVPEFWRTEVWHPLSVHFPIALLLFATAIFISSLLVRRNISNTLFITTGILLIAGTVFAWISVYTGDMAEGIVARKVCDPTVVKDHENSAFVLSYLFSAASIVYILLNTRTLRRAAGIFRIVLLFLMLTGSGFLIWTGHTGAGIVYQQAGGVYVPGEDCEEFE